MEYVELEVSVVATTPEAIRINVDGEENWVPRSQIEDNGEDFRERYRGKMYVSEWLLKKKGMI